MYMYIVYFSLPCVHQPASAINTIIWSLWLSYSWLPEHCNTLSSIRRHSISNWRVTNGIGIGQWQCLNAVGSCGIVWDLVAGVDLVADGIG